MVDKKIALFIDADNVSARFGKQIIDALSSRGEIFIRRIYGNWEKNILHGWNECILNFSLRPMQQTDFVAGKNATDMSLTIDAMDVLYGGRANVFALVSNDSDFTPLAIRLREGGMTVLGLGNAQAANSFRAACNEFIDLDAHVDEKIPVTEVSKPARKKSVAKGNSPVQLNLFGEDKIVELKPQPSPEKISPSKIVTPVTQVQPVVKVSTPVNGSKVVSISERQQQSERDKKIRQVHELLSEVAKTHGDAEGFTPLCWAGQTLRKKNLGFGIRDVGYSSFQAFVKAFPDRYEMIHRTNGENYCFRCRTNTDGEIERLHEALREAVKLHGDETGFVNLCWTGALLKEKNLDVKNFGFGALQPLLESFPKLYEVRKAGNSVSYRCKTNSDGGEKIGQLHDVLREVAKAHADADGFSLLNHAGTAIKSKSLSIKDFGHGTLQNFVAAFPNLYELRKVGKIVRYRCR
ncbi:MAG: NYN domain-containing protein [Selenomonadaceae bacterium]|nr:NYN domain-containing protein [Selenomonadaceae bacterium]